MSKINDHLFAIAREDFRRLSSLPSKRKRRMFSFIRLSILRLYLAIYYAVYFRMGFGVFRDMLLHHNCWAYLYNFNLAAKIGFRAF
jgi:hypothetical protein